MAKAKNVYFAKLAEQAERYDEMADKMKEVGNTGEEFSVEERNLLSVAYKNAVGSRRAAWRIISSVLEKEKSKGNNENAGWAGEYKKTVESELDRICNEIIKLLDGKLIGTASEADSKVFYQKMKADYFRYIAEFSEGDARTNAANSADAAYSAAQEAAQGLPTTHPIRLGLVLNYSVFKYEVMDKKNDACDMAKDAFEKAIGDLDNVSEESYKDSTLIMQLLRDNLTLWTSDDADAGNA